MRRPRSGRSPGRPGRWASRSRARNQPRVPGASGGDRPSGALTGQESRVSDSEGNDIRDEIRARTAAKAATEAALEAATAATTEKTKKKRFNRKFKPSK